MTADERILALIRALDAQGRAVMCAALWEGLKRRICTNESADEWADAIERIVERNTAK